ncbi:MAG: hypothetical protein CLLPBCKN_006933 [Chroococcidiopsis cubana SAG 39.79]|uniref:Addiction module toxin, HicA family protein n=1 Tax=Chroococcidiopsis cubana SAG 39.79 TaxID=388085 RepID=A0AB37U7U8_9CYAN|nr:type II toxin-antitoxin system HicA family toxin [Chroococcidiopsis cubana]MDZ4877498.1 hypothetical protein [Chroococcidiopsis cubana SAG 39.79]PSB55891.1 addiction module toxin, HicA family [Chroococcidiopsis cubana CCALA 043]RUS95930.1 addiction module toxin, HicA family protein [Chroococcidiopsis cubana SAG 39.79]
MKVKNLIRLLAEDGWYQIGIKGSHHQFKHPLKPGKVTVPFHESKDVPTGTIGKICKDARISAKEQSRSVSFSSQSR